MSKVLILYQSSHGHVAKLAEAVSEGARLGGAEGAPRRVPDLASSRSHAGNEAVAVATVNELEQYDAIIVGAGTRY